MACKIAVVGKSSFIASSLLAQAPGLTLVSRNELSVSFLKNYDVVVNCSISPRFSTSPEYLETEDMDLAVARMARQAGVHFVMLSTRRVYGQRLYGQPLTEASPVQPTDPYGANKAASESQVQTLLGPNCTILRLSNVFGYEYGRRTFFGMALTRLRQEGRILLDVSPFVRRDFIPVEGLADALFMVCQARPPGIYNLGSSVELPIGRVAEWLISGYGRGELLVTVVEERDGFVLDTRKLADVLGRPIGTFDFKTIITGIGKKLNYE